MNGHLASSAKNDVSALNLAKEENIVDQVSFVTSKV